MRHGCLCLGKAVSFRVEEDVQRGCMPLISPSRNDRNDWLESHKINYPAVGIEEGFHAGLIGALYNPRTFGRKNLGDPASRLIVL